MHNTETIVLSPIGVLHTPFDDPSDAPRQGARGDAVGELDLAAAYTDGTAGMEPGADVEVVWFAHTASRETLSARGRGVFTTRSPARPNPICITRCRIETVDDGHIRLRGVDMLDGTPVLDLKAPMT